MAVKTEREIETSGSGTPTTTTTTTTTTSFGLCLTGLLFLAIIQGKTGSAIELQK